MSKLILGSVNAYIIKGNKLLLSRRQNKSWGNGLLCAPGGHIEFGETPRQALLRELKEELNIDVSMEDLEFMCVAARKSGDLEYVAYEFVIRDKDYKPVNNEPDECSELVWMQLNQLTDDIIIDFRIMIEQALLGGKKYLEIGF